MARRLRKVKLTVDASGPPPLGGMTVEAIGDDGSSESFVLTANRPRHEMSATPGRYAIVARRTNGERIVASVAVKGATKVRLADHVAGSPNEFMLAETMRGDVSGLGRSNDPVASRTALRGYAAESLGSIIAAPVATSASPTVTSAGPLMDSGARRMTLRIWWKDLKHAVDIVPEIGKRFLKVPIPRGATAVGLVDERGFGPIVITPPFARRGHASPLAVTFLAEGVASWSISRSGAPSNQRAPVALVSLEDGRMADLLAAIAAPLVENATDLWEQSVGASKAYSETALQALSQKFERPAEAVLAAHYLLRFMPEELPLGWGDNLVRAAGSTSDAPAIGAWLRLLSTADDVEKLSLSAVETAFAELLARAFAGQPWFAAAHTWMARGLRLESAGIERLRRDATFAAYSRHAAFAGGLSAFWGRGPGSPGPDLPRPRALYDIVEEVLLDHEFRRPPPRAASHAGTPPPDGETKATLSGIAKQRIAAQAGTIRESVQDAADGLPLASEKDLKRLVERLMSKNFMPRKEAESTAISIQLLARLSPAERAQATKQVTGGEAEAIWGQTADFTGVSFFERGRRAANAVARVAWQSGRPEGTGFMVSSRLFLTNNHVIPTADAARRMVAEFDYELDPTERPRAHSSFTFAPEEFFFTSSVVDLDFTLVAVSPNSADGRELAAFGYSPLSDAGDKHAIGEAVNIVQHPDGRFKEVVLRENRLVARGPQALHYVADTEPGASGAPVFNNQWQAVALHHWGGPYRDLVDDTGARVPREVNEGIRISRIVTVVKAHAALSPSALLDEAFAQWDAAAGNRFHTEAPRPESIDVPTVHSNADGSFTVMVPVKISLRAELPGSGVGFASSTPASLGTVVPPAPSPDRPIAEALRPSTNYSDRKGYDPAFISGHEVPLPALTGDLLRRAALNRQAPIGANPHELQYHHFSVVVNRFRRLAFFAACNIDGRTAKYLNRGTDEIAPLNPSNPDHGLQESQPGAEAAEKWYDDERLLPGQVAGKETYAEQRVGNYTGMPRTWRMFQRGHLVRRLDVAWGSEDAARLGEADTFYFTNAAPQVGFFNMGAARPAPGNGGGKLWRAVENFVLRNARNERMRVSSFTGPIFSDNDRAYRDILIPGRFFKIAVWATGGRLQSLAMIADQRPVFSVWPEAMNGYGAEAFLDPVELARVDDFVTTVAEVEKLTGLNFGDAVRDADVRRGEPTARPENLEDVMPR